MNRLLLEFAILQLPKQFRLEYAEEWRYELSEQLKSPNNDAKIAARLYVKDILTSIQSFRVDANLTPSYWLDGLLGRKSFIKPALLGIAISVLGLVGVSYFALDSRTLRVSNNNSLKSINLVAQDEGMFDNLPDGINYLTKNQAELEQQIVGFQSLESTLEEVKSNAENEIERLRLDVENTTKENELLAIQKADLDTQITSLNTLIEQQRSDFLGFDSGANTTSVDSRYRESALAWIGFEKYQEGIVQFLEPKTDVTKEYLDLFSENELLFKSAAAFTKFYLGSEFIDNKELFDRYLSFAKGLGVDAETLSSVEEDLSGLGTILEGLSRHKQP